MNDGIKVLFGEEREGGGFDRAFSVIINIVIVALALVILMHVVIEPVDIIGSSMENGIHDGETVVINKLCFSPDRGDVVVIDKGDTRIIKRVIAVGGDKIGFVRNGEEVELYLDRGDGFVKQSEPYIKEKMSGDNRNNALIFSEMTLADDLDDMINCKKYLTVEKGYFIALGDNRNVSRDSRYYGAFANSAVVGIEFAKFKGGFWEGFFDFFYRGGKAANNDHNA